MARAPIRQAFAATWAAVLAVAALVPAMPAAAQTFPALTGRVVDAANVIPADVETRIDGKLAALETQSKRQLVVVTLPSLQGYEISDYGYQLGRKWGIGSKESNDGALLIVAPAERKLRIEVGYGLEGVLTDGMSSLIISQAIVPRLRAGDMPGGIEAGTDAIVRQLTLPEDQARALAAQAAQRQAQAPEQGIPMPTIVFLVIFFLFFILPIIRGLRGGRRRSFGSGPPVIVWGPGGGFGSGGGFGGGGGGFGGGFSGGGGSFGGGGASGSW